MTEAPDVFLDETCWPIMLIYFTRDPSVKGVQAAMDLQTRFIEKETPFVIIIDTTRHDRPPSQAVRKMLADHHARHREAFRRLCKAQLFVMDSVVMRMVARSILMMSRFPSPTATFPTLDEAIGRAYELLELPDDHPAPRPFPF